MNAPLSLLQRYQALRTEQSHLRQRDAATLLGVSEAELVAALPDSRRLQLELAALLPALAELGPLKAITRNHAAVHEKEGSYDNLTLSDKVALQLNPQGLDLRLFLGHWQHVFAVEQAAARGVQRSLQFYDAHGEAIHKLFLQDETQQPAWQALLARFAASDSAPLEISPLPSDDEQLPAADFDATAFADEWLQLKDVHHFHGLLRRHQLSRRHAFRLAPAGHAWQLAGGSIDLLLRQAARQQLPIMVFVGNRGMVQIHTGPVERIQRVGDWLNVLDAGFNLHLRDDLFAELWLVRRPTRDGIITSIEVFDAAGTTLVSFFGKRVEGEAELPAWRALAESLPHQEQSDAA